jgi:hypothetical protein
MAEIEIEISLNSMPLVEDQEEMFDGSTAKFGS